jgi:hypothetical protein
MIILRCSLPSVRLVEEMRAGADPDMDPKELTSQQVVRLHQLLHEVRARHLQFFYSISLDMLYNLTHLRHEQPRIMQKPVASLISQSK